MKPSLFIIFLIYVLIGRISIGYCQDSLCCKSSISRAKMSTCTLLNLGEEYKRLTKLKKGSHENWHCCDRWDSDLHSIINNLGERLGEIGTAKTTIEKIMGKPNASSGNSSSIVDLNTGETLMIYCWRGFHDYLYFVIKDGKVVRYDWWMAYE